MHIIPLLIVSKPLFQVWSKVILLLQHAPMQLLTSVPGPHLTDVALIPSCEQHFDYLIANIICQDPLLLWRNFTNYFIFCDFWWLMSLKTTVIEDKILTKHFHLDGLPDRTMSNSIRSFADVISSIQPSNLLQHQIRSLQL